MKNKYSGSILLMLFIPVILWAQVQNGSFESWSGGPPDGWTTIDGGISVVQNTSIVKAGSSSAHITVNTATQSSTDFRQTISVTSGISYTFSVWVYHTEGGVQARLYVDGYQGYSNPATTNSWQQISYTFTPASSSIEVGLRFYDVSGFDGSETVYVDDFQPASSSGGGGSGCSDTEGTFSLVTDNYGQETSWQIASGSTIVYSGSSYSSNSSYTEGLCLSDGSYTFAIYDSYGDGICCSYGPGTYSLVVGGTLIASGGNFGPSESTSFTVGSSGGGGGAGGSGYYASVDGLNGYTLKSGLHDIIANHSSQGYGALWTFYNANELDRYYENDGTILDIYSERPSSADPYNFTPSSSQCGNYSGEGDCYNREHSFPRSWFGGAVEPMNSDVHHIFASDGYVNGQRSSYPYGEVGSPSYTSSNGSKLGNGSGVGYSGTVFEPIDEFKGDLARAYFYMAVRYEEVISGWSANSSYADAVLDGSGDHVFESWVLNMLLEWHQNDPVSAKEIERNNAAYDYQGNRNPFVDHPEYAELIWSGSTNRITNVTWLTSSNPVLISDIVIQFSEKLLEVNFANNPVHTVQVIDITGRVVRMEEVRGLRKYTLSYSFKSSSIYLIKIYTDKDVMVKKVIAI